MVSCAAKVCAEPPTLTPTHRYAPSSSVATWRTVSVPLRSTEYLQQTFSFSNNYFVIVSERNTAANGLTLYGGRKKVNRAVTGFSTNRTQTYQKGSFFVMCERPLNSIRLIFWTSIKYTVSKYRRFLLTHIVLLTLWEYKRQGLLFLVHPVVNITTKVIKLRERRCSV